MSKPKACCECVHFVPGANPTYPDWEGWAPECAAKESRAWLKSFPYKNTKCPDHKRREPQEDSDE